MKNNIIQFPQENVIRFPKKHEPDPFMDLAAEAMQEAMMVLAEEGFNPKESPPLLKDCGMLLNIIYAMLLRDASIDHFLHDHLDLIQEDMDKKRAEVKSLHDTD